MTDNRPGKYNISVEASLEGAVVALEDGRPHAVVLATTLIATATRGLEREGFARIMATMQSAGTTETAAASLIEDSMEQVFDSCVEALRHISIMGMYRGFDSTDAAAERRLERAVGWAREAYHHWTLIQRLVVQPGQEQIQ